jgi:hypothetical protein
MYFDMRIGVIRDYSGNCQTIQYENREIQINLKNKFKKIQKI